MPKILYPHNSWSLRTRRLKRTLPGWLHTIISDLDTLSKSETKPANTTIHTETPPVGSPSSIGMIKLPVGQGEDAHYHPQKKSSNHLSNDVLSCIFEIAANSERRATIREAVGTDLVGSEAPPRHGFIHLIQGQVLSDCIASSSSKENVSMFMTVLKAARPHLSNFSQDGP